MRLILLLIPICLFAAACDVAGRDVDVADSTGDRTTPQTQGNDGTTKEPPPIPLPGCVPVKSPVQLCAAWTDNYKASFNDDPDVPEGRTWLAIKHLRRGGKDLSPVAAEQIQERPDLCRAGVQSCVGSTATLNIQRGRELVQLATFRVGPQPDQWGPLLQLYRPLRAGERVVVALEQEGKAGLLLEYRYDPSIAKAAPGSLEFNGPGGRWYIGGIHTPTNVELGRD